MPPFTANDLTSVNWSGSLLTQQKDTVPMAFFFLSFYHSIHSLGFFRQAENLTLGYRVGVPRLPSPTRQLIKFPLCVVFSGHAAPITIPIILVANWPLQGRWNNLVPWAFLYSEYTILHCTILYCPILLCLIFSHPVFPILSYLIWCILCYLFLDCLILYKYVVNLPFPVPSS